MYIVGALFRAAVSADLSLAVLLYFYYENFEQIKLID